MGKGRTQNRKRTNTLIVLAILVCAVILLVNIIPMTDTEEEEGSKASAAEVFYENRTMNYQDNPFTIYWSDPEELTDVIIDPEANIAYLGSEYGLIVKNLTSSEFDVVSYFEGLEWRFVSSLALDKKHSRIFVFSGESFDKAAISVVNTTNLQVMERYKLDDDIRRNSSSFKSAMYYDSEGEQLYIGGRSGLIIFDLESKKYEHYNRDFFINLNRNWTEIKDLDYNHNTHELYIASFDGLYILNTTTNTISLLDDSNSFEHFRLYDVNYVEEKDRLYMAGYGFFEPDIYTTDYYGPKKISHTSLVAYNLSDGTTMAYPPIKAFYGDNETVYKTVYDPVNNVIVGTVVHDGMAVFDADSPVLFKNYMYESGDDYLYSLTYPNLAYNSHDEKIYLGNGLIHGHRSSREEVLYVYDFVKEYIGPLDITGHHKIESHSNYPRLKLHQHSNNLYLNALAPGVGLNLIIFNEYGEVIQNHSFYKFYNNKGINEINDIEFIGDKAYIAPSYPHLDILIVQNITTQEFSVIESENLSSADALYHPENSNNLYVSVTNGVTKLNLSTHSTEFYSVPLASSDNAPEGLAVSADEKVAYLSDTHQVAQLNLTDGSYFNFSAHRNDHCGKIDMYNGTPILGHEGIYYIESEEIKSLPNFPETATISTYVIDHEHGILYAVTGAFYRGNSWGFQWSKDDLFGVIVYDLNNNTWTAYNMTHGLPLDIIYGIAVNPKNDMIYVSGENFFAYASLNDLQEFDPQLSWRAAVPETVFTYRPHSNLQNMAVIGSAGLLAILLSILLSRTEIGTITFFKFITPFYTRIRKEDILDNFVRGQLFDYIRLNPGAYYTELKKELGVNNGTLTHHLHMLEMQGFIVSKRKGIHKLFYPEGMKIPEDGGIKYSSLQLNIIEAIKNSPGINQTEIAKMLNQSVSVINYNIKALEKVNVLRTVRKGRESHCYIEEDAKIN